MPGMNQDNKIAIVTGGTGALGRVIVNHFASKGMKVYVPVRSMKHFMNIFDESQSETEFNMLLKRYAIECDATDEDQVREFCENVMKQEKRIDSLINTIGGYHPKTQIQDTSTALITSQLQLNFYTTFYFTKYALTYIKQRNFGRIVSFGAKPSV